MIVVIVVIVVVAVVGIKFHRLDVAVFFSHVIFVAVFQLYVRMLFLSLAVVHVEGFRKLVSFHE